MLLVAPRVSLWKVIEDRKEHKRRGCHIAVLSYCRVVMLPCCIIVRLPKANLIAPSGPSKRLGQLSQYLGMRYVYLIDGSLEWIARGTLLFDSGTGRSNGTLK